MILGKFPNKFWGAPNHRRPTESSLLVPPVHLCSLSGAVNAASPRVVGRFRRRWFHSSVLEKSRVLNQHQGEISLGLQIPPSLVSTIQY